MKTRIVPSSKISLQPFKFIVYIIFVKENTKLKGIAVGQVPNDYSLVSPIFVGF